LSKYFQPTFDGDDILRVPNYNTIIRTLVHGVPTQPFSMATLPPLGNPNDHLAKALKQLSAVKYGRQRSKVEQDIFARMKTAPAAAPAAKPFGSGADAWASARPTAGMPASSAPGAFGSSPTQRPGPTPPPKPASGSSFLDEWLQKRKQPAPSPKPASAPAPRPVPQQANSAPLPAQNTTPRDTMPVQTPSRPSVQTSSQVPPRTERDVADFTPPKDSPMPDVAVHKGHHERTVEPPKHDTTKNISSQQLDQNEIDKIASELKEDLSESVQQGKEKRRSESNRSEHAQAEHVIEPGAQVVKPNAQQESEELKLPKLPQTPRPAQHQDAEDTIYIDQEGNLVLKNPAE
jgi:hypothetical protein